MGSEPVALYLEGRFLGRCATHLNPLATTVKKKQFAKTSLFERLGHHTRSLVHLCVGRHVYLTNVDLPLDVSLVSDMSRPE